MWILIQNEKPPVGQFVKTKIDDGKGVRNESILKYNNKLWYGMDGLYVYWTPTHWFKKI